MTRADKISTAGVIIVIVAVFYGTLGIFVLEVLKFNHELSCFAV